VHHRRPNGARRCRCPACAGVARGNSIRAGVRHPYPVNSARGAGLGSVVLSMPRCARVRQWADAAFRRDVARVGASTVESVSVWHCLTATNSRFHYRTTPGPN
jgi:hypothetical protein